MERSGFVGAHTYFRWSISWLPLEILLPEQLWQVKQQLIRGWIGEENGNTAFTFPVGAVEYTVPIGNFCTFGCNRSVYSYLSKSGSKWCIWCDSERCYTCKISVVVNIGVLQKFRTSAVTVTAGWGLNSCNGDYSYGYAFGKMGCYRGKMENRHGNGGVTGTISAGTIVSASALVVQDRSHLLTVNSVVLPIHLVDFHCTLKDDNKVRPSWTTASETNNDFLQWKRQLIQYISSKSWECSRCWKQYAVAFTIIWMMKTQPNQSTYYRLKQTDFDGKSEYSGYMWNISSWKSHRAIELISESCFWFVICQKQWTHSFEDNIAGDQYGKKYLPEW